jgi:hypothetical protein
VRQVHPAERGQRDSAPSPSGSFAVEYPNPAAAADVPRGRALAMRSLAQPRASAAFSQVFSSAQAVCSGSDQPCRAAVLHDCTAAQQPPFAAASPVTPSQRRAQPYRRGRADPLGLQLTQFALVTVDRVWELRCASEDETHQWMDGEPFAFHSAAVGRRSSECLSAGSPLDPVARRANHWLRKPTPLSVHAATSKLLWHSTVCVNACAPPVARTGALPSALGAEISDPNHRRSLRGAAQALATRLAMGTCHLARQTNAPTNVWRNGERFASAVQRQSLLWRRTCASIVSYAGGSPAPQSGLHMLLQERVNWQVRLGCPCPHAALS